MREMGGYIELDTYHLPMLHEGALALNCGRNALAYLFKSKQIKKLRIPYFICQSVMDVCNRENVQMVYYHIGIDFKPTDDLILEEGEWLYLVNYYGQLNNSEIEKYVHKYSRVIVDQANGYFEAPISGVDTIYTCRKWFGVSDGAFLYTDITLDEDFPQDESFDRMRFLLGRYEKNANEFYGEYVDNNRLFSTEPIKRMSKLTKNLLHAIDYKVVEKQRRENFKQLHSQLNTYNLLNLQTGMFMYPFMTNNGAEIRRKLVSKKIYIPVLWPSVLELCDSNSLEYKMAKNILPLPIDQRYGAEDMEYILQEITACL